MDQEWQARAVAHNVTFPSGEQYKALHKRLGGVVKHEADDRLRLVWRVKAPTFEQAVEIAREQASCAVSLDLGNHGTLRQLHVIHADDIAADRKEILAALGIEES
jgi:hypothetical protein